MHRRLLGALFSLSILTACSDAPGPSQSLETTVRGANAAAISSDASLALVAAVDHGGSLWDLQSGERLFDWNHQQGSFTTLNHTRFSRDNLYAVTASPFDMVLWSTQTGEPQWYWKTPDEILDIELVGGGNFALLGLANAEAVIFDIQNGGVLRRMYHPASVRSVATNADGNLALTGADDYVVRVWDTSTQTVIIERQYENIIDSVALAPNEQFAFSAETLGSAQIWNIATGELIQSLSGDEWYWPKRVSYLSARFSNDSSQLLTGSAAGLVQLWDVASGTELQRWRVATKEAYGPVQTGIYDVAFGPGNSISALGSNGIWNRFNR
ncbi:MAG TPA: hypothetical protein VLA39_05690 [Marinobacterium sp.]|nr:hypothetical protein [Marinobacterium sp.]